MDNEDQTGTNNPDPAAPQAGHTSPTGTPAIQQAKTPSAASRKPPSWRPRSRLLVAIAVALAATSLVLISLAFAITKQGDNSNKTGQETSSPSSTPAVPLPTLEDLANTTLIVPAECAEYTVPSAQPTVDTEVAFTNGTYAGMGAGINLNSVHPLESGRHRAIVVELGCWYGNSGFSMLAVYDEELTLLDSASGNNNAAQAAIQASTLNAGFTDLSTEGATITATLAGLMVAGDGECNACHTTNTATITYDWNGSILEVTDVLIHTAAGDFRPPDQDLIQEFYDNVASGNDAAAQQLTSIDLATEMAECRGMLNESGVCNEQDTTRALQFPVGATVGTCMLAPDDSADTPVIPGETLPFGSGFTHAPGSYLCGIPLTGTTSQAGQITDRYIAWLVVTSDINGKPTIVDLGRAFG